MGLILSLAAVGCINDASKVLLPWWQRAELVFGFRNIEGAVGGAFGGAGEVISGAGGDFAGGVGVLGDCSGEVVPSALAAICDVPGAGGAEAEPFFPTPRAEELSPRISPDNRWIAYVKVVQRGNFGQSDVDLSDFTVAPDGRILVIEPSQDGPGLSNLRVVLNWWVLLERRARG